MVLSSQGEQPGKVKEQTSTSTSISTSIDSKLSENESELEQDTNSNAFKVRWVWRQEGGGNVNREGTNRKKKRS
ncbi:uncharacterized protein ARB_05336 [Trichophyton benhamiae CBS 112371]|uniref:Uncharacterized protein n=1 Tax=Arthroderma benhamiae (strain ATCC MYA-4681 / CBS 112371) TaxID=663331 RepID=D4ALY8_ARTBC|nr:uncharacterized protein ARB_05336 [Trichophyton benhamiae CBS 112371]EFE36397.1 hypothetical protein ARB_05336 [Trichophyton benhamiae CBS 112371]